MHNKLYLFINGHAKTIQYLALENIDTLCHVWL